MNTMNYQMIKENANLKNYFLKNIIIVASLLQQEKVIKKMRLIQQEKVLKKNCLIQQKLMKHLLIYHKSHPKKVMKKN